jgi:hypothetical protein
LDRSGAAVLRQQREVNVKKPLSGGIQYLPLKKMPVGDDDAEIGLPLPQFAEDLPGLGGLTQRKAEADGRFGDGGGVRLHSPSRRAIGLSDDGDDFPAGSGRAGVEKWNGHLGGSEEDESLHGVREINSRSSSNP